MESGFADFRLWRHETDLAGLVGDVRSRGQNRSDGRSVKPTRMTQSGCDSLWPILSLFTLFSFGFSLFLQLQDMCSQRVKSRFGDIAKQRILTSSRCRSDLRPVLRL
jgi:hypothetical protein